MSNYETWNQIEASLSALESHARTRLLQKLELEGRDGTALYTNGETATSLLSLDPEDWKCPISLDLMFDPVIAEDGKLYDKLAIEHHFEVRLNRQLNVTSPVTNESIGQRLVPAPWVKSHIQTKLIDGALVPPEVNENWKKSITKWSNMGTTH